MKKSLGFTPNFANLHFNFTIGVSANNERPV